MVNSIQTGLWSDPLVWDTGIVPQSGESVIISSGHIIDYDVFNTNTLDGLSIFGTLRFSRITSTQLRISNNILVEDGGFLDIGTEADFIPSSINHEIIFVLPSGYTFNGGPNFDTNDIGLWVLPGGRWESHGQPLNRTWSKLRNHHPSGKLFIEVEDNVGDWPIGGDIILSSTQIPRLWWIRPKDGKLMNTKRWEEEVRTITDIKVRGNGTSRITLDKPLSFNHSGLLPFKGEAGLLTRNIKIMTEQPDYIDSDDEMYPDFTSRLFAHTRFERDSIKSSMGSINYTEFKYMGHHSVLGRYPIHLHKLEDASDGMIIRGNSVWVSGRRWIVTHETKGVLIEDNVGFNSADAGYYIERSDAKDTEYPRDNVYVHNLGIRCEQVNSGQGNHGVFWTDKLDNHFLGNVGTGARGGGKEEGFGTESFSNNTGNLSPMLLIYNEFHSNGAYGIRTWNNAVPGFLFLGNKIWRNGIAGYNWGAYDAPNKLHRTFFGENAQEQLLVTSINGFLQDSKVLGGGDIGDANQRGFFVNAYIASPFPYTPIRLIRTSWDNISGAVIEQEHSTGQKPPLVSDEDTLISTRNGQRIPTYIHILDCNFNNIIDPFKFGNQHNKNTYWLINNYSGNINLPRDFIILRSDQLDIANQTDFTDDLISSNSYVDNIEVEGLITDVNHLPRSINYTNVRYYDGVQGVYLYDSFTFDTRPTPPPLVDCGAVMDGQEIKLRAFPNVQNEANRLEWYLDGTLISSNSTSGKNEISIDLSVRNRKYSYIYCRVVDVKTGFDGYSEVFEVGPEFKLPNYI